jgi:glutamate synthase (NADPH) small chain
MGKITGFLEIDRQDQSYEPAADRVRHYREAALPMEDREVKRQAARCMDCGMPYCHTGCPVNNQIPDWNDLVYADDWHAASRNLHSTNNFPEFTGRICPAPCEEACTLNLEDVPVTIKTIEQAIADKALGRGLDRAGAAEEATGFKVAIVGSGSAGLAAAQQLARVGHEVHVFERAARAGGLLRYGIPDFKMEKHLIDRRVAQMEAEGVVFHYNCEIGNARPPLAARHLRCGAARLRRGAPARPALPGMELDGCHYAMPYLVQQNKRIGNEDLGDEADILAGGKHVVVIGGGDTASDCIGTAFRQGACLGDPARHPPLPARARGQAPGVAVLADQAAHLDQPGRRRRAPVRRATLAIVGEHGHVTGVRCARVDEKRQPLPGTEFTIQAELVLIAIGFAGPERSRGSGAAAAGARCPHQRQGRHRDYRTSHPKVFAAGDMRKGQSLVVWAIREGRQAARAIDLQLRGETTLPR